MKRTNIYPAEAQTASLDKLAAQQGVSRAELIRQLLNRALTGVDDNLASDLEAIDGSFGALREIELPVRRPAGREKHRARASRSTTRSWWIPMCW
ncbi:ribbon-helix-helix domain-containing protein [Candidatus Mycobacterium methanotrophicum]|uniref:Ribbon-helix-helix domain-containing protein n=1 Tax=Candidatus Mycobacterium methanotrophicum TaxID=2943498 RepID=A0ABY4QJP3_9MYCO|nr:CopG family transcriptional regulator [Candidatus Mycobacterium methanotrophicum]UQX10200.1 ribbon-helix-helix domain-containing protein [Candidatus Mycobacterium methanotrophicum]